MDDESSFPKATDTTFVEKLHKQFEKLPFYTKPKTSTVDLFTISHYAGQVGIMCVLLTYTPCLSQVEYDAVGFLEKNRDSLPTGANELMQASKNPLIELIFKGYMMCVCACVCACMHACMCACVCVCVCVLLASHTAESIGGETLWEFPYSGIWKERALHDSNAVHY